MVVRFRHVNLAVHSNFTTTFGNQKSDLRQQVFTQGCAMNKYGAETNLQCWGTDPQKLSGWGGACQNIHNELPEFIVQQKGVRSNNSVGLGV